ncbi:MAG: hypothetical protein GY751_04370 [Bacteroidetes bacterium]|nr:hypothetical protein [Bacteroidota bacterium]
MNKFFSIIVTAVVLLAASCLSEDNKSVGEGAIAKSFDNYLFISDIPYLQSGMHPADSINLVNSAIDNWLIEQLVFEKSTVQLPSSKKDEINQKVADYQRELYAFAYEKEIVNQKMDTVIVDSSIVQYHEKYTSEYLLEESFLRFVYVKCDKEEYVQEVEDWMKDSIDIYNLEDFCSEELQVCHLYPDKWVSLKRFTDKLDGVDIDMKKVRSGDSFLIIKEENIHYLIRILEFKDEGQAAPLTFVRREIYSILLNKRKKEFLNSFYRELISNETVKGNVKIFENGQK